ncbi:hypothetical protein AKJ16_DCAP17884 [Drosera capensis]
MEMSAEDDDPIEGEVGDLANKAEDEGGEEEEAPSIFSSTIFFSAAVFSSSMVEMNCSTSCFLRSSTTTSHQQSAWISLFILTRPSPSFLSLSSSAESPSKTAFISSTLALLGTFTREEPVVISLGVGHFIWGRILATTASRLGIPYAKGFPDGENTRRPVSMPHNVLISVAFLYIPARRFENKEV